MVHARSIFFTFQLHFGVSKLLTELANLIEKSLRQLEAVLTKDKNETSDLNETRTIFAIIYLFKLLPALLKVYNTSYNAQI